ncbi:hypothetical protein GCM10019998_02370 [Tetragenococcus solitarius]|uniref:Uncharacterized protein n=1 Tax=Tetragenococcus solitarius TaxID=71453 RepID=A0ABN3XZH6_9ENTE
MTWFKIMAYTSMIKEYYAFVGAFKFNPQSSIILTGVPRLPKILIILPRTI